MRVKVKTTSECLKIDPLLHGIGESLFYRELAGKEFTVNKISAEGNFVINWWMVPPVFCRSIEENCLTELSMEQNKLFQEIFAEFMVISGELK